LHRKITNSRRDFLHKTSRRIAETARTIVIESLNIQGMLSNHHLAKALCDASLSELHRQIEYKVMSRGGTIIYANQWSPSSKRCSNCGHVVNRLELKARPWICPDCNSKHDRDLNAARCLAQLSSEGAEVTRGDCGDQNQRQLIRCHRMNRESAQRKAADVAAAESRKPRIPPGRTVALDNPRWKSLQAQSFKKV
jgi:IS605 OrfB family transposase